MVAVMWAIEYADYMTENHYATESYFASSTGSAESALATNEVLRNIYMLLSMTLVLSAACAGIAMAMNLGHGTALILSLVGFGLLFIVNKTADSSKGIIAIFAFTGVLGASIGPMLNHYLAMPQRG